jgi:hypothetical protein
MNAVFYPVPVAESTVTGGSGGGGNQPSPIDYPPR